MFTATVLASSARPFWMRISIYLIFCVAFGLLTLSAPANADRLEYIQCLGRCDNNDPNQAAGSCAYHCESFLNRPGPAPMPAPPKLYGAIAIDGGSLLSGFAKDAASQAIAEQRALAQCRNNGGSAGGCKVIVARNNSCMALATSAQGGSSGNVWG